MEPENITQSDNKPVAIKVRELVAGYDNEIVLNKVTFDVFQGEIFVILGSSGCGKSTLLKHLIGLIDPISGEIEIGGIKITGKDRRNLQKVFRKYGVLFQNSGLLSSMTLAENVALPLQQYTNLTDKYINTLVKMKLSLVNLSGFENHLPSEISGGMRKRAGLARALSLNPSILFFDEPSAGLDPVTSAELDRLIIHLNHTLGTTMVIVTHELPSIFTVAHRVIMLDKRIRGIIADGTPQYLRDHSQNPYVKQFFNREVEPLNL
ncbi:MAG: polyamine ABC transporter ATP-binding protein [Candidatus Scalindua sp.]|nr:MAG: polyamine ABC transporter ATP-binding protein [Candidatus Scalindua sp.]